MRTGIEPLHPEGRLDDAARILAKQGCKSLLVVDGEGTVVGMLTETDFLRRLEATTFLELLMRLVEDEGVIAHRCHDTPVSEAMTAPAVTVALDADFRAIVSAFHAHVGRSMPVVDDRGGMRGLLLRKELRPCLPLGGAVVRLGTYLHKMRGSTRGSPPRVSNS